MSFQRTWGYFRREYSYTARQERALLTSKPITKIEKIVIKPTSMHPALLIPDKMPPAETFADLRLRADVINALHKVGVTKPTLIQMLAIPKILRGKNILCAAETGSGKTLAYLAPMISRLRDEEEHHGMVARLCRPRALILLPSRDLAKQILSVAKSLGHIARFRALGIIGGRKRKIIKNGLDRPVDIAVATPDCLQRFQREGRIELSDLSHIVIDEADTLLDDSFAEAVNAIMKGIQVRGANPPLPPALAEGTQITIVAATVSSEMLTKIQSLVPNLKKATTKHLHQILPHIHQTFVKVMPHKKSEALLQLLREHPNCYTIVFCNSVSCCDWAGRYLEENGVSHIRLHGGLNSRVRVNRLQEFLDGRARVLISTDIASRGIDTSKVTRIVLYDFPYTLADYIHRVGRTGRVGMNAQCRAVCFMTHRRDVHMAWMIKDAADKRIAIMNKQASKKLQLIA